MMKYLIYFLLLNACINTTSAQTSSLISFDGINISYSDEGAGPVVFLIHGFINTSNSWNGTEIKKSLLENGYRVIAPDLRGNGLSDKPHHDAAYMNDAEIKDLQTLADQLNISSFDAVGYSRGSIVLAKLLVTDNRVKKAVLGGIGIDFTNPDWDRRIMFAAAFNGETEMYPDTKGAVEYANSIGADLRCLHLQQKYQPVTSLTELKSISAKTLVIAGDHDIDNGDPAKLSEAIPGSSLKIVPGDHNTTYRKTPFSKAVVAFLAN